MALLSRLDLQYFWWLSLWIISGCPFRLKMIRQIMAEARREFAIGAWPAPKSRVLAPPKDGLSAAPGNAASACSGIWLILFKWLHRNLAGVDLAYLALHLWAGFFPVFNYAWFILDSKSVVMIIVWSNWILCCIVVLFDECSKWPWFWEWPKHQSASQNVC